MEHHPRVGYVFCPVVPHIENRGVEIAPFWYHAPDDAVFEGRLFLRKLRDGNCVPAPSGMVRRTCYERIGLFPLDMPYSGDWYLWSAFATEFDVGYLSEPMVRYRWHDTNMTHQLRTCDPKILLEDDLAVRWRIARHLGGLSLRADADGWWSELVDRYASLVAQRERDGGRAGLSMAEARTSWERHAVDRDERDGLAARVCIALGDRSYRDGQIKSSRRLYRDALRLDPRSTVGWLKYVLACSGELGVRVRTAGTNARRILGRTSS